MSDSSSQHSALMEEKDSIDVEEGQPFLHSTPLASASWGEQKSKYSDIGYIVTIAVLAFLTVAGFGTAIIQGRSQSKSPSASAPVPSHVSGSSSSGLLAESGSVSTDLCETMNWRREWRDMPDADKKGFTSAVVRLMSLPSDIYNNHSRYDDFQFIHGMTLDLAHRPGSFLTWHRLFLKNFETALRHEAGYRGYLPYWDWTRDWQNLTASPIFDDEFGFGGTGDPNSDGNPWRGYCVTSGPFANHEVPYIYVAVKPHCLSRDFATQDYMDLINWGISPAMIDELLEFPKFTRFNNMLQSEEVHLPIIKFIVGDMSTRGAPGEPLWWLHHAQLDRLYWLWQQRNPISQGPDYNPFADFASIDGIPDVHGDTYMDIGALGEQMTVKSMFDTRSDFLCYGYM